MFRFRVLTRFHMIMHIDPGLVATAVVIVMIILHKLYVRRKRVSADTNNIVDIPQQLASPVTTTSSVPPSGDSALAAVPLPAVEYEVFLSFRGPDTRHYFTDILYRFLIHMKIRTFKDDNELRKGEGIGPDLFQAINRSKIHVPIFSESYADSKWCLNELVEIMKLSKQGKGHLVLPIFYMTDPRDVRHQTGPYESAFQQHQRKNVGEKIIQSWKDALNEVGTLKGWHINNKEGVGAVIDEVSSTIWSHLSKDYTLDTDKLVGIDDHVKAVVKRLNMDSDLNIDSKNGLGGIEKTTIAKAVYNNISNRFQRCCFVENIRETQKQKDGIVVLQKKILCDILRKDSVEFNNSSEGKKMIKERASQFKLLMVLDDVDENLKFEDILGSPENFVPGSTFLFTSRNYKVLSDLNENPWMLYEVGAMSHESSLELLCNHAFKTDSPPPKYKTVANGIVSTTGGLPLTLKVLGSLLYKEDITVWEEKMIQLWGTVELRVMDSLKISYDTLPYEAQQIFLDVACFLVGKKRHRSCCFWNDCQFYPGTNLLILVQRSMLKLGENNKFQMHDQLRDMGREIVRREDIEHPWMRSRIWDPKDAIDTLSNNKVSNKVKAIRLDTSSSSEELKSEYFSNSTELRYLDVGSSKLTGDFSNFLPNLRWLRVKIDFDEEGCPSANFHMKNMVVLDLGKSKVTNKWGGWSQIKTAGRLKVLALSLGRDSFNTKPLFPESLEILVLKDMFWEDIVLDISGLRKLKLLTLKFCYLKEIKGTIGMLRELEELHLYDVECPDSRAALADIGECSALTFLDASICKLLDGIKHPTSLKVLKTSSSICNLGEMTELKELTMTLCKHGLELPFAEDDGDGDVVWWKESKLNVLKLEHTKLRRSTSTSTASTSTSTSSNMVTLLPSSLTSLEIVGGMWHGRGKEFSWLPSTLENLANLTRLLIMECSNLREIQGIEGLISLENLVLFDISGLRSIQGLEDLIKFSSSCSDCKLETLAIGECRHLTEVLSFNDDQTNVVFDSLKILVIDGCPLLDMAPIIRSLSKFPGLVQLKLDLGYIESLNKNEGPVVEEKDLEGIGSPEELTDLELVNFPPSIKRMPYSISKLHKLSSLEISCALGLQEIPGLGELKSLLNLTLTNCPSLERLWPVYQQPSGLKRLKNVEISGCEKLTAILDELKASLPNAMIECMEKDFE
ncbi:Disease resistance protein L6 [Linum grandiflorum]